MKKTAIMQPYFMPYIGYWQLIDAVDTFVVYDNIEYTKKGWFNRNRILEIDHDRLFTIPLKKDSDFLPVDQRFLSGDSDKEIARTLRIIQSNYKKAPHFTDAYPVIEACFLCPEKNLFAYIFNSIQTVCEYLGITTKLVVASTLPVDHALKAAAKVQAICQALHTQTYINAVGGMELYDKREFAAQHIDLQFIKSLLPTYEQLGKSFVPGLSIIDVMMFNGTEQIRRQLEEYELV